MTNSHRIRLLLVCLAASVLLHILTIYAWRMSGTYNFSEPVNLPPSVEVDLSKSDDTISAPITAREQEPENAGYTEEEVPPEETLVKTDRQIKPEPKSTPASTQNSKSADDNSNEGSRQRELSSKISPLATPGNFLTSKYEKLIYAVSMLGFPVGSAELEAKYENGEIWFTLRVKSNTAISTIFPVDNLVETRHIGGRFIMSRIQQREGSLRSDESFTINLMRKRVSWFNYIDGRSFTKNVPADDVLDTLSGIYFLRNRQLEVGKAETLNIFDSETYAEVPVEILRRESVLLPNLTEVETLVVQPLQKTAGIFRRTGDVLIWLTDDANKVPVKIVTSIELGRVTIELLSAESTPLKETVKTK